MLNSRFRALVAVMAFATAALAACGGGSDDDDKASVRLVNATARASLDLLANRRPHRRQHGERHRERLRRRRHRQPVAAGQRRHHQRRPGRHRADGDRGSEVRARRLRERRRGAHGGDHRRHRPLPPATRRSFASSMPPPTPARSTSTSPIRRVDITTLSSPTFSFTASTSVQASNFASFGAPPRRRHLPDPRHRRGQPVGPAPRHPAGHPAQPAGRDRDPHAHRRRHAGERVGPGRRTAGSTPPPPTPTPGCACSPRSPTALRSRPPPSRPAPARRSASAPTSSRRRSPPMSTSRRTARSASR